MRYAVLLLLGLIVSGCSSGNMMKNTSQTQIDQFSIQWSELRTSPAPVPKGLTPLFFRFGETNPSNSNGVTEADFEREAAAMGVSRATLNIILGDNVYKGRYGRLARCTISAIEKGLCGKPLGLSIEQRIDYARRALAASDDCSWVGFDPTYNAIVSRGFGAEDYTLHVAARC